MQVNIRAVNPVFNGIGFINFRVLKLGFILILSRAYEIRMKFELFTNLKSQIDFTFLLTGDCIMKLIKRTSRVFYGEVEIMTLQLKVPKIACSACANTIAQAVKTVDPAAVVEADIKTKLVTIQSVKPENEVRKAIASVGYPAL